MAWLAIEIHDNGIPLIKQLLHWLHFIHAESNGVNSDFVDFVIRLLQAPASSASVEHTFSNLGQIHSKIRNRLGNQTAGKLVFCFSLLRGDNEIDY